MRVAFWQRRPVTVAAIIVIQGLLNCQVGAEPVDAYADRSKLQLPVTLEFERRAKAAFETKDLRSFKDLYLDIGNNGGLAEDLQESGTACGCDVALSNLIINAGFAINKLDGKGNFQRWMDEESMNLLGSYHDYLKSCASDAGVAAPVPQLTAELVKAL